MDALTSPRPGCRGAGFPIYGAGFFPLPGERALSPANEKQAPHPSCPRQEREAPGPAAGARVFQSMARASSRFPAKGRCHLPIRSRFPALYARGRRGSPRPSSRGASFPIQGAGLLSASRRGPVAHTTTGGPRKWAAAWVLFFAGESLLPVLLVHRGGAGGLALRLRGAGLFRLAGGGLLGGGLLGGSLLRRGL